MAMRLLIRQVRDAIPFDLPQAQVCTGLCNGCSVKLLDYLDTQLCDWEERLAAGERPGLADLSRFGGTSRVWRHQPRGVLGTGDQWPASGVAARGSDARPAR